MKFDVQKVKTTIKNYPKISFLICILVVFLVGFVVGQQNGKNQPTSYSPSSSTASTYESKTDEEKSDMTDENKETPMRKNDAVNIAMLKRDFVKNGYSENFYFEFQYTNNTEKTIKAFKGSVMFYDVFGEMLLSVGIEYLEPIKAGETVIDDGYWDYNQFMTDNIKFRDQPDEDVSYKYNISEIIYLDEPEETPTEEATIEENTGETTE